MTDSNPALPLAHLPPEHGWQPHPQVSCHVLTGDNARFLLAATLHEDGELRYHENSADLMLYFMENCKGGELLIHNADETMLHLLPHLQQMAVAGYDSQICVSGQDRIIYAKIGHNDKKKRGTWRIRDTHSVLPMPLSELGAIAGMVPQEPGGDERAYLASSCKLILQAFQGYSKVIRRQWQVGPARTSGATALKTWRRRLNPEAAHWRQRKEVEVMARDAYVGGMTFWTDRKPTPHTDMVKLDVNAMYASVMRDAGVPTGLASGTTHFVDDEPGIYHVRCTCPSPNPFPFVPQRTDAGGIRYPVKGIFETVVPSITIEAAERHGYTFECIWGFAWERIEYLFTEWVGECEAVELGSLGQGYKKVIKSMRNSLSGKFGQREIRKCYIITDNPTDDMTPAIGLHDGLEIDYLYWYETEVQQPHIQPHWAAWITAAARNVLAEAVYAIGPGECVYGDTDSIVTPYSAVQRGSVAIGARYGEWKMAGEYKTFMVVHTKTYIAQHYDGSWELKHNGVPASCITPNQIPGLLSGTQMHVLFPALPRALHNVGNKTIISRTIAKTIGVVYDSDRWANGPPGESPPL